PELFDQIEKDIRRECLQFLPQQIDIIIDGEVLRCMAQRPQSVHYIRLGLPLLRFQFVAEILVNSRWTGAVEKDENFELFFHGTFFCCHSKRSEESQILSWRIKGDILDVSLRST